MVFAHVPLWTVYPEWGWGTDDGAQALALLKRFGSVTVLNGHIHQIMQKVEGNITFHTAMSTAFPQPRRARRRRRDRWSCRRINCATCSESRRCSYLAQHRHLRSGERSLSGASPDCGDGGGGGGGARERSGGRERGACGEVAPCRSRILRLRRRALNDCERRPRDVEERR